ncbi:hypothetical protein [Indiicoccus explosivorum]|uniref:hypothetical protein n=1 Tax=Indiicoccus explosivorum TaxID=1917864 RepID=UPI000B4536F5|nr:hypothetical protein [Indiicoccus explosivorum]
MTTKHWIGLIFIIGFIILHFSSKYMKLSPSGPRSNWLSLAGGGTIAYTFIYLIPELAHYLTVLKEAISSGSWLTFFEDYTYILALLGLLIYFGLDTLTNKQQKGKSESDEEGRSSFGFFMVHITAFFFYNFVIGYIFVVEDFKSYWAMGVYFLALGAHFIGTDHKLDELHEEDYDKYGRYFLIAAIFAGWLTGVLFNLPESFAAIAISILAGGLILNTFKEEVKATRASNYWFFAAGTLIVTFLHVLIH